MRRRRARPGRGRESAASRMALSGPSRGPGGLGGGDEGIRFSRRASARATRDMLPCYVPRERKAARSMGGALT